MERAHKDPIDVEIQYNQLGIEIEYDSVEKDAQVEPSRGLLSRAGELMKKGVLLIQSCTSEPVNFFSKSVVVAAITYSTFQALNAKNFSKIPSKLYSSTSQFLSVVALADTVGYFAAFLFHKIDQTGEFIPQLKEKAIRFIAVAFAAGAADKYFFKAPLDSKKILFFTALVTMARWALDQIIINNRPVPKWI
jgi:hypothetical protein